MIKTKIFYFLWMVLSIGILFSFLEISARIAGIKTLPPSEYSTAFWTRNEMTGYTVFPNTKWSFIAAKPDAKVHESNFVRKTGLSNAFGFRTSIINNNCAECPVILTIGDSVTFNAESNDNETWPEVMAITLKKEGREYHVQNLGMSGFSAVQSYIALKEAFSKIKGIDIVIYSFVMNDIVENFEKDEIRRPYFDSYLNIRPPVNKPEWDKAFDRNRKLERFAFIKYNLATLTLIKRILKGSPLLSDESPQINISDEHYVRTWKSRIPVMQKIQTDFLESSQSELLQGGMREAIRMMSEECIKHNVKFFVLVAPMAPFSNTAEAVKLASQSGMSAHDFKSFLLNHERIYNRIKEFTLDAKGVFLDVSPIIFADMSYREYVCHPDDLHYGASANKKVGQGVAKELINWLNKKTTEQS